jgi:intracellular sulfur oxidation DsrE/DsrF family protein
MTSDEQVTMDGATTGQDAQYLTLTCPFAAGGDDSYNPPLCNIVQEGSSVDLTVGSLSTETMERFIMVAVPDTTPSSFGIAWPYPLADPGTEADYSIAPTGFGDNPASGSATAYISAHVQEGRNVIEDGSGPYAERYPKSEDLAYSETTAVSGDITLFSKELNYLGKITGNTGRYIVIPAVTRDHSFTFFRIFSIRRFPGNLRDRMSPKENYYPGRCQESTTPHEMNIMIERYGAIHKLPDASGQPEKDLDYRIIYAIAGAGGKAGDPSPGLLHIARTLNLFEWADIPREHMHLKAAVYGDATPVVLSDGAFKMRFNRHNPNSDLIDQLVRNGVEILVCGQSFLNAGFRPDELDPAVTLSLSALTVIPNFELKGYARMMY